MLTLIQNDPEVPPGLFATLLAERGVPFRLVRLDLGAPLPEVQAVTAAIVLGGRMGVHDEALHPFLLPLKVWMQTLLRQRTPLFGICLGGQLLAEAAGGAVHTERCGEHGVGTVELTRDGTNDPLFAGTTPSFSIMQWHNDSFSLPPAALPLAASAVCPVQAFRVDNAWGVQFHPEVDRVVVAAWCSENPDDSVVLRQFLHHESDHAALGRRLLANFLGQCADLHGIT